MIRLCGRRLLIQVDGRERVFTEEELVDILRKHYKEATSTANRKKANEDEELLVDPLQIDEKLFQKKRENQEQERTRQLILEAFEELKSNSNKYGRKFKLLLPKKKWPCKTVAELKEISCELGSHMADWVEQALEWAQRIANGEPWEIICNEPDTANWYRLVVWKNGCARIVGGSFKCGTGIAPSEIFGTDYGNESHIYNTVPLVVLYED